MDNSIETFATALYVKIDDMLADLPDFAPGHPADGMALTLSDAELLTMAVMSALLAFTSERRWLRYVMGTLDPGGHVPAADRPVRVQQAASEGIFPVNPCDPDAGHGHLAVER